MNDIKGFSGEFRWLSNFANVTIEYDGFTYSSVENAYQASKCKNEADKHRFLSISSRDAKKLGRIVEIVDNFDKNKLQIMKDLCNLKYNQEPFKTKLISTGNCYIEETNTWNDTYWGICNGIGKNNLGQIIMDIRNDLIFSNDLFEQTK